MLCGSVHLHRIDLRAQGPIAQVPGRTKVEMLKISGDSEGKHIYFERLQEGPKSTS